jgi:hypothetical protein
VDISASPGISSVDVTVSQAIRVQGVTCEVQQLLGEGTIRCVAMEATEGLKRGAPAVGVGRPILDRSIRDLTLEVYFTMRWRYLHLTLGVYSTMRWRYLHLTLEVSSTSEVPVTLLLPRDHGLVAV